MGTPKILVAEDSSVIRSLTGKILSERNFTIRNVKNGLQVMQKIESELFDVILMDINMPGMNGLECCKNIRALPDSKKSKIPIIAISGNPDGMSREEIMAHGFNDFIEKPLNFDLVIRAIQNVTHT